MSTESVRFFHRALSLFPLIAEMNEAHFTLEKVDAAIQKIASCLQDQAWTPLYKSLIDYQMRLLVFRDRVLVNKEHLELEKIGSDVLLPRHMEKQLQELLPVRLSSPKLSEIRQKIERMLTDFDWSPLRRKLMIIVRRIDDLIDKLKSKTLRDRDIERIGLTNLIKHLGHPPCEIFYKLSIDSEFAEAASYGDIRNVREMILKNPDIVFSATERKTPFFSTFCENISHGSERPTDCKCEDCKIDREEWEKERDLDQKYGSYPLSERNIDLLKLLIRAGANVNPIILLSNFGCWAYSPLQSLCSAYSMGNPQFYDTLIKILLDAGADPSLDRQLAFRILSSNSFIEPSVIDPIPFSLLMQGGMNVNALRITVKEITDSATTKETMECTIKTPLSWVCGNHLSARLTFLGTLIYSDAIVYPATLKGISEKVVKRIQFCQDIKKSCSTLAEGNIVEYFKGCSAIAQLALSYILMNDWCYQLEDNARNSERAKLDSLP